MFACLTEFQAERKFEILDLTDMQVRDSNYFRCLHARSTKHNWFRPQPEWWASNFAGAGAMNNYNNRAGDIWVGLFSIIYFSPLAKHTAPMLGTLSRAWFLPTHDVWMYRQFFVLK